MWAVLLPLSFYACFYKSSDRTGGNDDAFKLVTPYIYVIAKFVSYVVELLSKAEAWSACGYPMRNIWRKDSP